MTPSCPVGPAGTSQPRASCRETLLAADIWGWSISHQGRCFPKALSCGSSCSPEPGQGSVPSQGMAQFAPGGVKPRKERICPLRNHSSHPRLVWTVLTVGKKGTSEGSAAFPQPGVSALKVTNGASFETLGHEQGGWHSVGQPGWDPHVACATVAPNPTQPFSRSTLCSWTPWSSLQWCQS